MRIIEDLMIGLLLGFSVACLILGLFGCGSQTSLHPNISRPERTLATTPRVEFMGDDQIQGLVAYVNNPLWKCSTCAPGKTSAGVLGDVPAVVALRPDLVVIQTGAYDLLADPTQRAISLDANIDKIVAAFEAAKIPVVICMLPATTEYDDYYFNEGLALDFEAGIVPYVFTFNFTSTTDLTVGLDYSQAGLAEVAPAFYQDVESFGLGGTK